MVRMGTEQERQYDFRGWIEPRLEFPQELLQRPVEVALRLGATEVLHCEGREILRIELPLDGNPAPCFLYLFRNRSYGRLLRPSYAQHCLAISNKLRELGFETLTVLAALRPSREWLNWNSLMIALELQNVCELPSSGNHLFQTHEWARLDEGLTAAVAREVSRFHSEGFVHGDLKTRHILVKNGGNGHGKRLAFVDLEKTAYLRWVPSPLRDILAGKDLVQLLASLPDDQAGNDSPRTKQILIETYFQERRISAARERRIRRIIDLYGPDGLLNQGQTVAGALWRSLGK